MSSRPMSQQKMQKSCEQFVLSMYKTFSDQPSKLQSFTTMFLRFKKSNSKLLENQMKLSELIQEYPELIDQLNVLVPPEYKIPRPEVAPSSSRQQDEDAGDINKVISELQARCPGKVQQLIELIKSIKSNKNRKSIDSLKLKLSKILEDEPNLLKMFMKAFQPYFEETQPNGSAEPEPAQEDEDSEEGQMEVEEGEDLRVKNKAVRGAAGGRGYKRGAKGRRGGNRRGEPETSSPKVAPAISLPVTVRNELNLFDNLRVSLSKGNYQQLMKMIYLYTECVIGANEVYMMVKPLFRGNENYANLFQEMIFAREKTRRKNTELFKPLSDIDFERKKEFFEVEFNYSLVEMGCLRCGSYSRLPEHFPHMKSPINPKHPGCDKYLNKCWLSVPHGSETNFIITAKNAYEENLFKVSLGFGL